MNHPRLTALAAGVLFAAMSVPIGSVAAAPVELQENASYFGHGRIDAFKAVAHDTSRVFMETPHCPECSE